MANVMRKQIYARLGCIKLPSFSEAGNRKQEYSAKHAPNGMVSVSCRERPSSGGDGLATLDARVHLLGRRCTHGACDKHASVSVVGTGEGSIECNMPLIRR